MSEHQNFKTDSESNSKKKLTGLGGWLIIFQILLFTMTFNSFLRLGNNLHIIFSAHWYIPVLNILSMFAVVFCLIMFYVKRRLFRVIFAAAVVLLIIYELVTLNGFTITYGEIKDFLYSLIFQLFIVGGLFTSKRVKNTFK